MPGRSTASWEYSRDAGWHGTGPEGRDIAICPLRSHLPQSLPFQGEGEDTELSTLESYFLSTLPNPQLFPLTPAGATGQVWAANKTQTEQATQRYLPGPWEAGPRLPPGLLLPTTSPRGYQPWRKAMLVPGNPARSRILGMEGGGLW